MDRVVMDTNFILLIIFLMSAIYWFATISDVNMGQHKRAFGVGVLMVLCACICRIACIYVDYRASSMSVDTIAITHMFYLSSLMLAYGSYGYLNLCFLNYNFRWKKEVVYIYFTPCAISILLMIISRYTGLVYYVSREDGYAHGPLHFVISLIPIIYVTPGLVELILKRKYLPRNLIHCTIATIAGFAVGMFFYVISSSKSLLFAFIALIILVQLFAVLFYDSFWDEETSTMNQKAFDVYVRRYLDKNKKMELVLIQIVGFHYFRTSRDTELMLRVRMGIAEDLKNMIKVNTIYYLGNGSYVVAIDEDEKKIDRQAFLKEVFEYCNQSSNPYLLQLSPDIDISYIRLPEDCTDPDAIYAYVNRERGVIEIREEKVRLLQGDSLCLEQAFRAEKVEQAVARAVQNHSFQVYYQPLFSTMENRCLSAEALVRLIDEELGFIPPDEFIPLAEKTGMIMDVGMQVFEEVCRFIHEENLKDLGIAYIEINISIGQFLDDSFAHKLAGCMEKYQVSFDQINLEITETATPFEENRMRAQLKKMAEMGFSFSLDDYGTGYSNIEAVTEYPLELIKLDKSIVWSAFENEHAMVTMKSLIHMFHRLGFGIVAEGVETEEMVKTLSVLHCDYLQGYFFSKPIPEADFITFLRKSSSNGKNS